MKFACSAATSPTSRDLVTQAVAAEQPDFDAVLGSDHFHPWVDEHIRRRVRLVLARRGRPGHRPRCSWARGHLPAVPLPPGPSSPDGRRRPTGSATAASSPASAPARPSTSGPSASPSPATPSGGPHAGSPRDHAPPVRQQKLTFDGDYYQTTPPSCTRRRRGRCPSSWPRRPEVGAVRRHLRRRPHHQREEPADTVRGSSPLRESPRWPGKEHSSSPTGGPCWAEDEEHGGHCRSMRACARRAA